MLVGFSPSIQVVIDVDIILISDAHETLCCLIQ